jgi:hypothetical protein
MVVVANSFEAAVRSTTNILEWDMRPETVRTMLSQSGLAVAEWPRRDVGMPDVKARINPVASCPCAIEALSDSLLPVSTRKA